MGLKTAFILLGAGSIGLLIAQDAQAPAGRNGGRGPAQFWWASKSKGGIYVPPNKPLTRLADLQAKHAGQTNWTEVVVKDPEDEADYNSAASGTKSGRLMHPDTGTLFVVVAGDMRFDIAGQEPIAATRGSIVNILKTTPYSYEVTGGKPALWVQISPTNFKTVYPADGPPPPAPSGADNVKVSFFRAPPAYAAPNMPHWNLFEAAKTGVTGYRALQDHLFANPIYGYADPNDPENPNRGNAGGGRGRGGAMTGTFNPNSGFGHMHPGPAEWWIVQSGQIVGRFENTGEFVGSEGDILYAAPMTWHQMAFKGPGLSCRLALGAYDFINMNNTAGQ